MTVSGASVEIAEFGPVDAEQLTLCHAGTGTGGSKVPPGLLASRTDYSAAQTVKTTFAYPNTDAARGPHQVASATREVTTVATGATAAAASVGTFGYDPAGRMQVRKSTPGQGSAVDQRLEWDAEGLLATVKNAAGEVLQSNFYGPGGQRLLRREAGKTTLWLGQLQLTLDHTTRLVSWQRYYSFEGATVAVRDGNKMTDVQILVNDRQNTGTWAIETSDGTPAARRSLPYGGTRGPPPPPEKFASGRRFVGVRDYDTDLGLFLSPAAGPGERQPVNPPAHRLALGIFLHRPVRHRRASTAPSRLTRSPPQGPTGKVEDPDREREPGHAPRPRRKRLRGDVFADSSSVGQG